MTYETICKCNIEGCENSDQLSWQFIKDNSEILMPPTGWIERREKGKTIYICPSCAESLGIQPLSKKEQDKQKAIIAIKKQTNKTLKHTQIGISRMGKKIQQTTKKKSFKSKFKKFLKKTSKKSLSKPNSSFLNDIIDVIL